MATKAENFIKKYSKEEIPDIRPGDTVRVHQKIKEAKKERIQIFEGVVLARKHGKGISSTITVRKLVGEIGIEKIFPLHSPTIEKIDIVQRGKVRRAKLYYLRKRVGKKAKVKKKKIKTQIQEDENTKNE
ncbi:50S ribosomal protein L19 [bacterium]|nr:50S ribosomal protein L19 [bacterium]